MYRAYFVPRLLECSEYIQNAMKVLSQVTAASASVCMKWSRFDFIHSKRGNCGWLVGFPFSLKFWVLELHTVLELQIFLFLAESHTWHAQAF
jgi:hypothetical protein